MTSRKRAASESGGVNKKVIKLEDGGNSIIATGNTTVLGTNTPRKKKKSQSEPPSFETKKDTPATLKAEKDGRVSTIVTRSKSRASRYGIQRRTYSPSISSRSSSTNTSSPSSLRSSHTVDSRQRTNSLGKSIQNFHSNRAASAPVLSSSASLLGSTPTVRYMGPPNQLVRSAAQQQPLPAPPSASSSGTNSRKRTSGNSAGDQAGPSILMRIEWASIDNPFLCGGHPILLQGKGTIPEMMNTIKSQVTRFENSLKKKLAK